jgi:hypothetical protein
MDVVAPPAEKAEKQEAVQETQTDPLDKLAADDQKSQQAAAHDKDARKTEKHPVAKAAEPSHNGVGLAITATVIIVLSLAALATYAYIQTSK